MKLCGTWFDRTREYRSKKCGPRRYFPEPEEVRLSVLPCLSQLFPEKFEETVRSIVQQVERETQEMHRTNGTRPAGRRWVLGQSPHRVPKFLKKSPAKKFLSSFLRNYVELRRAYRKFLAAYREAANRLKSGDLLVEFPPGCFPPRLPFVRAGP
jgi:hypothetical protein